MLAGIERNKFLMKNDAKIQQLGLQLLDKMDEEHINPLKTNLTATEKEYRESLIDKARVKIERRIEKSHFGYEMLKNDEMKALKGEEVGGVELSMTKSESKSYDKKVRLLITAEGSIGPISALARLASKERAEAKGLSVSSHYIDQSMLGKSGSGVLDELKRDLANIRVGDDAKNADKGAKIELYTHGDADSLLTVSSYRQTNSVTYLDTENVVDMLAANLEEGNYHGKLTIALRGCLTAAVNHDNGMSTLSRVSQSLGEKGYIGIKVTGSEFNMSTAMSSSRQVSIGTAVTKNDFNVFERFSGSNHKQERLTMEPPVDTLERELSLSSSNASDSDLSSRIHNINLK